MPIRKARISPYVVVFICAAAVCANGADLHVAAAANLTNVLPELSSAFQKQTGNRVIPSYGATAQLAQQIENGAPMDVFLAADTDHVDGLVKNGFVFANSRIVYARGRLVVWVPDHPEIRSLPDLASKKIRHIAIATPSLAPYGAAAIASLKKAGLWDKVQEKAVYAPSIAVAKQYADTGNAEAAFTAYALTIGKGANQFPVDESMYPPIEQAAGIVKESKEVTAARGFTQYLASPPGRAILKRFGYIEP